MLSVSVKGMAFFLDQPVSLRVPENVYSTFMSNCSLVSVPIHDKRLHGRRDKIGSVDIPYSFLTSWRCLGN